MSERLVELARRTSPLLLVMAAVSGNATASSATATVAGADDPPAASATVTRQESGLQRSGVATPVAAQGVAGHPSPSFAGDSQSPIPVRKAKIYALALSSFAMLGMIALHRI